MKRLWIVVVLGPAALLSGCVTNSEITIYTYETHHLPRVHVNHRPVSPAVDEVITFTAVAEVASVSGISSIGVQQMNAENEFVADLDCDRQGAVATCVLSDARNDGPFFYRAYVQNTSGKRTYSPGTYEFQLGRPDPSQFTLTPLRVPLKPNTKVSDDYRIDVVLIRDATGPANSALHLGFDEFLNEATGIINDGILADPIYRWRDHQLGFWVATRTGRTTSFYDGRDSACGQNPWPGLELPQEILGMEVLGVLHRRPASGPGYPLTESIDFRDCAGQLVLDDEIGTFSTKTGETKSNLIAKHEYGHAAFGLGDEYTEGSTRNVPQAFSTAPPSDCCCACTQQGGDTDNEGEGETPTGCVSNSPNGVLCFPDAFAGGTAGLAQCEDNFFYDDAWVPLHCGTQSEGRCPPIESQCVLESAWLGATPPDIVSPRVNVFPSETECQAGLEAASAHPGVENEGNRLGACRQLCGNAENPCPCGTPEVWITDVIAEINDADDAMADLDTTLPHHGGTCAWCVETSLCVRWQSSHINDYTNQEIWQTCQAPPKWTRHLDELIDYLGCWLAGTCGREEVRRPDPLDTIN